MTIKKLKNSHLNTETKKFQRKLNERKGEFQFFTENTLDIIITIDLAGTILSINRPFPGVQKEIISGMNILDFVSKDERNRVWKIYERVFNSAIPGSYENKSATTRHWYWSTIGPIKKGHKVVGAVVITRDITKHKNEEKILKDSEERYRALIETSPDSIVTIDFKGVIASCNKSGAEILGYTREEIIGNHFSKIGMVEKSELIKYTRLFKSILAGKEKIPIIIKAIHKNGTPRWLELRVNLIKKDRDSIAFLAVARDITERKKPRKRYGPRRILLKILLKQHRLLYLFSIPKAILFV